MYTKSKPAEPDYATEAELLQDLIEMVKAGAITAVLLPEGKIGWIPTTTPQPNICPECGGMGFSLDDEFELLSWCLTCGGTGEEPGT